MIFLCIYLYKDRKTGETKPTAAILDPISADATRTTDGKLHGMGCLLFLIFRVGRVRLRNEGDDGSLDQRYFLIAFQVIDWHWPLWGIFQKGGSGVGEQGLATPAPNSVLAACNAAAAASLLRAAEPGGYSETPSPAPPVTEPQVRNCRLSRPPPPPATLTQCWKKKYNLEDT